MARTCENQKVLFHHLSQDNLLWYKPLLLKRMKCSSFEHTCSGHTLKSPKGLIAEKIDLQVYINCCKLQSVGFYLISFYEHII